jgi:hypothetical protein
VSAVAAIPVRLPSRTALETVDFVHELPSQCSTSGLKELEMLE